MATTFTPNADLALMATGDEVDNWGVVQNNAIFLPLDGILGATLPITMTTTDVTLTLSQWQSMAFVITGVLTGNLNLIFPLSPQDVGGTLAVGGARIVNNRTTGNFTITVKTAATGSAGIVAPQGYQSKVYSDTADVAFETNSQPQAIVYNGDASATISSDQNDYVIATTVAYARLNVTTSAVLTGITNGTKGRQLELFNVGTATLTLLANSSASTSGNRFAISRPFYLKPNAGVTLVYDGTTAAWRVGALIVSDPPAGLFTNLAIKVLTNTTASVSASNVTLTDGIYFLTTGSLSATLNLASSGSVNQLDIGSIASATSYFVYAISNGVTMGTLASLSSTNPTLPSGYTFFARIGALRTAAAVAQLMGTWQLGRTAQYIVGLAQTTVAPKMDSGVRGTYNAATPVWQSISVTAFVPSTASRILIGIDTNAASAGSSNVQVAPNNGYGGFGASGGNFPPFDSVVVNQCNNFWMMLESTSIYWASNGAGGWIVCSGWEDNI